LRGSVIFIDIHSIADFFGPAVVHQATFFTEQTGTGTFAATPDPEQMCFFVNGHYTQDDHFMQWSDDLQSVYPDCIKIVRIIFSVILYPAEKKT
jgi:hypothetical protein